MKLQVIAAFRHRKTGELVKPGDPVPKGLDAEAIQRLIRARCLKPLTAGDAAGKTKTPAGKEKPAAADGLFPETGGAPMARADGGPDSGRAEPDDGGRGEGEGPDTDDSDQ